MKIELINRNSFETSIINLNTMKTKFIFLMMIICSFMKAQVFFQTPYATNITATTATLNVYMNLNNTYQVGYQISTDSNFAGATIQGQQNTFAGTYNLTKPVTGLTQNTTYYIRFRALSGGNADYSPVGTFTTASLTPDVFGIYSSGVTNNSATINYTLNAKGSASTSIIKYGTNINALSNQVAGFSATGTANAQGSIPLSGLAPNTQYFYRIEATNSFGTTVDQFIYSFTTTTSEPSITNISVPVTSNSATINYTINAGTSNATSLVRYGLSSTTMTNEITGFSVLANTSNSSNVEISGLLPDTQYFYQIDATNSLGTTSSSIGNFRTNIVYLPQIIAEYNFNNTYNNMNGSAPFASNGGTSFVQDRNGNPNSAISIVNLGTSATIPNLPYGNLQRTVSLWVKLNNVIAGYNFLYSYGAPSNPEGAFINATNAVHFLPSHTANSANTVNTWYHYVFTYNGSQSKIYRNGTLVSTSNVAKNTVNNIDIFTLGLTEGGSGNYFNGAIDDLKIYNYAITDSEVANLYNNNSTLAVSEISKTKNIRIYPNPVKDFLHIKSDSVIDKVEVFSLEGKKLKETNQNKIDVSELTSGVYIIKTIDNKGTIETNKFIKN